MAQYRIKELSILAGVEENTIRKHIERGKLIKNEFGYIDTENHINMLYTNSIANYQGIKLRAVQDEKGEMILINLNLYENEDIKHLL